MPEFDVLVGSDIDEIRGADWPIVDGQPAELFTLDRPVELHLRLPDGRSLTGKASSLFIEMEQHRVATVGYTPLPETVPFPDAVAAAKAVYEALRIPENDSVWKQFAVLERKKPNVSSYGCRADIKGDIEVFTSIKQIYDKWYIAVSVTDKSLYPRPPRFEYRR